MAQDYLCRLWRDGYKCRRLANQSHNSIGHKAEAIARELESGTPATVNEWLPVLIRHYHHKNTTLEGKRGDCDCAQDDEREQEKARANAGILRCAQNDNYLPHNRRSFGSLRSLRMTSKNGQRRNTKILATPE
jgi:hypothetical protein